MARLCKDFPPSAAFQRLASGLPNCFTVLGCGGNGVTFSVIAADIVRAWVEGRSDPDAGLFQ